MNTPTYLHVPDLLELVPELVPDSIISKSVTTAHDTKVILFAFAAGQELSEHTAARPAILHFLSGTATVTLGKDSFEAQAHSWVQMPAHMPHSIEAHSDTYMLLLMLPANA